MNEIAVMTDPNPVRWLFETHLTVSDLQRSIGFYPDIVGLELAFEPSERTELLLNRRCWAIHARIMVVRYAPLGLTLHLAFDVALDDLGDAPKRKQEVELWLKAIVSI
jgi:lactoylglutathione lyase